jgi:hypothetical protein
LVSLADFDGLTPPKELKFERESFWIRMYNLPLACMGKTTGEKIRASVGVVEEVDVWEEAAGWGEYLRVKISIDLSSPLARGRMLHLQGRSNWVAFKYEKLPKFCYYCGVIKHGRSGCIEQGAGKKNGDEEGYPYGPWLRVAFPPRRGTGGDVRRGGRPTTEGQGKERPDKSSQPGAFQQRRPRTSEKESDGGGNSFLPNTSLQGEQSSMEGEQASMDREQPSMEKAHSAKAKGKAHSAKAKGNEGILHVNGAKVQYLGQWDSGAGRMVYEPIGASDCPNKLGEEILDQHHRPRVRSGSKEKTSEDAGPINVSPSIEVTDGLNKSSLRRYQRRQ